MVHDLGRSACLLAGVVGLCAAVAVQAQQPGEVLLIANSASEDSLAIAGQYAAQRGIPAEQVVKVRVPMKYCRGKAEISPRGFTRRIWTPVQRAVEERGLADRVLAWVYSVDFPVRITAPQPVSLTGITFVRNELPEPKHIREGTYLSPVYGGPDPRGPAPAPTLSLAGMKGYLGDRMPLPCMMLGYIQEGGNDRATVERCLRRGLEATGTNPTGTFFLCWNNDVRAKARKWQFEDVAAELNELGQRARVLNHYPTNAPSVMGMMIGRANVPGLEGNRFLPGAAGDHLTSSAAIFHAPGQDRLTRWIAAGCAGSAGTVIEPFAIWSKFPHARMFVHYAKGATLLESYYAGLRCPLQLLVVGDPLCRPWDAPSAGALEQHGAQGEPRSEAPAGAAPSGR